MQLSVIIVNYNVRAFLENALVALVKAMHGLEGEIIVVDNASDDGSVEMVRQKFPGVTLIVNRKNIGFAAANNIALARSRGTYCLLINPDTLVQEDTLRTMIGFMEKNPDAGMAGCKILNPDGTLQLACRRSFPTPWVAFTKIAGLSALFPGSRLFGRYNLTFRDPDLPCGVDAVSGSFMFVRRKAYEEVGGLDEQFFMYGEDLDWCYRFTQSGWRVVYVPATSIIHYKGESAKRSDIDEVRVFYQAMRIFARKHFAKGILFDLLISTGISLRQMVAFLARSGDQFKAAGLDFLLINIAFLCAERIWFGRFLALPHYAYPAILIVPWLVIAGVMYSSGCYTTRQYSGSRTASSVFLAFVLLSALTFFFKQYGFSRVMILLAGGMTVLLLPGWRVAARVIGRSPLHRRKSPFGRRTLIVGSAASGQEVLRKIRARVDDGYEVVGFIETDRKRVGEKVAGVEILGTIDNIGKIIEEFRASEVIFSTDLVAYTDILSVISRSRNRSVNYHLVPSSLEVIIGKTHIDELDDMPLVEIEYHINRPLNRIVKRAVDVAGSVAVLITIYPIIALERRMGNRLSENEQRVLRIPEVFRGRMSLVGPPEEMSDLSVLGKPGITGLVQVNYREDLSVEETEKYNVYYAKNQSFLLDIEILAKSLMLFMRR